MSDAALEQDVDMPSEHREWTPEELADLLKPGTSKTGVEIAAMLNSGMFNADAWSEMLNPEITDSVEWVKALRHNSSKHRKLNRDNE